MCRECTPGGPEDYRTTTVEAAGAFEAHARDVDTPEDMLRPSQREAALEAAMDAVREERRNR
jgi:hypothetical protein